MNVLVIGESGSGKSEYAEDFLIGLSKKTGGKRYYIAAMKPYGKDASDRIARHRALRAGKGFTDVECYSDVKNCDIESNGSAILECMSNLAANEMFDNPEIKNFSFREKADFAYEKVCSDLDALMKKAANLVIVTNDVFSDGAVPDEGVAEYMRLLAGINAHLAKVCDKCVEVVYSIPVVIKDGRGLKCL